ncbi:MAG: hypothetical protein AA908_00310 [Chlorobi bacterium NICIL-2]|nr:MAG: hypothetical protein AA908_00310 [Chlorobi bacterium NICIL-2]
MPSAWQLLGLAVAIMLSVAQAQQVQPPLQPEERSPASVLQERSYPVIEPDTLPGGKPTEFLPEQDTFYLRALRLQVPPSVRLALDVERIMSNFEIVRRKPELESPWQAALRNMTLSARTLAPEGREMVQRQLAIASATAIPVSRGAQIGTVSIPMSAIGSFLGISEDVSPRISYRVRESARVVAVVYSTTALIVRRLLDQEQRPGMYELEWDGRDDSGRRMPDGDYVLEVRIGDRGIERKRVVLSQP